MKQRIQFAWVPGMIAEIFLIFTHLGVDAAMALQSRVLQSCLCFAKGKAGETGGHEACIV
jgi:hypothetical protein